MWTNMLQFNWYGLEQILILNQNTMTHKWENERGDCHIKKTLSTEEILCMTWKSVSYFIQLTEYCNKQSQNYHNNCFFLHYISKKDKINSNWSFFFLKIITHELIWKYPFYRSQNNCAASFIYSNQITCNQTFGWLMVTWKNLINYSWLMTTITITLSLSSTWQKDKIK